MKREHPYPQPYPRLLNDHNGTMRNMKEYFCTPNYPICNRESYKKRALRKEKKKRRENLLLHVSFPFSIAQFVS